MAETPGYGTTVSYATTIGGSYTALSEVVAVEFPEVSADAIQTTHMTSTGQWHTFQAGLTDPGEMTVTIHWDKTIQTTVMSTLYRTDYFWKITFNDAVSTSSTYITAGFISKVGPEVPLDDIVTVTLTIKCSGAPTFTAGS